MKKGFLALALLLCSINLLAQYKVQFYFKKLPAYHKKTDKVYVAGSFNNWNPKDERYSTIISNEKSGIAFLDISTGEFFVAEGDTEYMDKLLQTLQPAEVIFQRNQQKGFKEKYLVSSQ